MAKLPRSIVIIVTAKVVGDLGSDYGNAEATNEAITEYVKNAYSEGGAEMVRGVVVDDVQVADVNPDDIIGISPAYAELLDDSDRKRELTGDGGKWSESDEPETLPDCG